MKLLSEGIIEKYLIKYINNKWTSMQLEDFQYPGRRFPFVIEEAVLNTALTGSIFQYMHDNNDYSSTLVSEAKVKRTGDRNGRCDIIWYSGDTVHYIELKSVFLYDTAEENLNKALYFLNEAVEQAYSIVPKDMFKDGVTENERWYGYTPKHRYGFVGGFIFSEINNRDKSFINYQKLLNNDKLVIGSSIKPIVYENQFTGEPLDISYYRQEGQKVTIKSDGYFFICAEFEI
ncbi:MAG TPA: hypothetical protein GXX20_07100 [Clostridiaceae bacterium]|nr:hypothetical protein [Clostridiaceae bacterium]